MSKVTPIKSSDGQDRKAGVTFTYADCNNRELHMALEKLDNYTGFSGADLSRFMKIKNTYDRHQKMIRELFKKLVDKHAYTEPVMRMNKETGQEEPVLDKKGKPVVQPAMITIGNRRDFHFKDKAAFNKDYKELMSQTFTIESFQLLTEDLMKAQLTPKEIRLCAKMVSDIDPELITDTPIFEDGQEEPEESDSEGANLDSDASDKESPSHGTSEPTNAPAG